MIALILQNFGLSLFVLAMFFVIFHRIIRKTIPFSEILYRWIALFPLGITALYAFVLHAFFPDFTAATIGWPNSPFQFEVAMANLGFGIIAILSFRADYGFRLATVIGNTCWLWGDALGHVYQIITNHNFTVGNAGSWFWLDILVPLMLILCLINLKNQRPLLSSS